MPNTKRALSDLLTLLADNTSRQISAQRIRDFLVSVYGTARTKDIVNTDSPYTPTADDGFIVANAASGNIRIDLPTGAAFNDTVLYVEKTDPSTNYVRIYPSGGDVFSDGSAYREKIYSSDCEMYIKHGTEWDVFQFRNTVKHFYKLDYGTDLGSFRVKSIASNSNANISFWVPVDFRAIISTNLVAINIAATPAVIAFGTGPGNIELASQYATVGEAYNTHSATPGSGGFTMPVANRIFRMPIDSVFPSIAAGDACGLNINHHNIGGAVGYIGVEFIYHTK